MGCVSRFFKFICASVCVFVGVLLGPNTLPETAKFSEFHVTPAKDFKSLKINGFLNNAERLFEEEIKGPEGFEVINGELYTTLHGGYVAKIYEDQVVPVVKFGETCIGWWEESKCGRPLGIKSIGNDQIIVADAYFGIFHYNLKTRKITNLVSKDAIIDGKRAQVFNAVEVAKDGTIYWTHSSTDFSLEDNIFTFLADGTGRLIKYDPVTKTNTVIMKNLYFANGLALSPKEDFLLVAETGHSRILKYYLQGPKKFQSEIFIEGLPGMPDNLRSNGEGGFFVPLVVARDNQNPAAFQIISSFPKLRKFLAQSLSLLQLCLGKIHQIYPNYYVQRVHHYVGHLESVSLFLPVRATVLEIDLNGNIIRSYHGVDGSVTSISDVIAHNGYLYLGSPVNNYLGRVELSKLRERYEGPHPSASATTTRLPQSSSPTTVRPPVTTIKPPPPTTRSLPPSSTNRPASPSSTKPLPPTRSLPPSTTNRLPSPPSTEPPPPTTRSLPPSTTRPPSPPPTKLPPPTTNRPPSPPSTKAPPPTITRPPSPPPTTTRPTTATTPATTHSSSTSSKPVS